MIHVFDTSVLKWSYYRNAHHRRCRYLLSRREIVIAEISVLELMSALGAVYRDQRITLAELRSADRMFLGDLASGRLRVYPLPSAQYMNCRQLLAYAGVDRRRHLKAQDGIIAFTARELAIERQQKVRLLTGDKRLAAVVQDLDVFRNLVEVELLLWAP
jgi:PIN domain-containing protein